MTILICIKTTLNIDENLLAEAMRSAGVREKTAAIRMGLECLIQSAAARRLAALGGTMPRLKTPKRKRSTTTN